MTENKPLVQLVKSLNAARKAAIAADSSFLTTAVCNHAQLSHDALTDLCRMF